MAESTDPRTWRRGMTLAEFWERTGHGRPDLLTAVIPATVPASIDDIRPGTRPGTFIVDTDQGPVEIAMQPCQHPFGDVERTVRAQRVRRDRDRLVIRVTVTYVCGGCDTEVGRDVNSYRVPDAK